MSADLKIELYAYTVFYKLWKGRSIIKDVPDILEIYGDECAIEESYFEACENSYYLQVAIRGHSFTKMEEPKDFIDIENITCLSELFEYIVRVCDQEDLLNHLTVFEKMLVTSLYASDCSFMCYDKTGFKDALKYGHLLWAMYFDKFTNEFYEKGGWSELKRISKSYNTLACFIAEFAYCAHFVATVKQAVVNYNDFKNSTDYQERKHNFTGCVSKLWIKFRAENLKNYKYIPTTYTNSAKSYELELLLRDLMLILNPSHSNDDEANMSTEKQKRNVSTEMSHSEIPCDTQKKKANVDDSTQTLHLVSEYEGKVSDKTLGGFSHNSTDCKGESQISCPISTTEESTSDISDSKRNLEGNEYKKIVLLNESNDINSTNNSYIEKNISSAIDINLQSKITNKISPNGCNLDLDCTIESKSFLNKNEESAFELFNEQNGTEHTETANTDKFASLPYTEKTESHSNPIPEDCVESDVLNFPRESISNNNQMETNLNSINSEIVSAGKESVSSMNQIVACNKNGLSSDPYKRDFDSTTVNASCVKRRKKRKVREEQKDPDIQKFLNMILVLGDLEGAQFLLSTWENNEKGREKPKDDERNAFLAKQNNTKNDEMSQERSSKSKKKFRK